MKKDKRNMIKKICVISVIILLLIIIVLISVKIKNNIKISKRNYFIESIETSEFKYFITNENSHVGVIDCNGNQIIEPIYDNIIIPNPTKDVFACIYNYNSFYKTYEVKIINSNNEELFTNYERVEPILINNIESNLPYEKNVLKIKLNNKYGLIDLDGNVIVDAIYDELDSLKYREGEFIVKTNNKYGVINNKGYIMVPFKYDLIEGDKYYSETNNYKNSGYIVGLKKDDAVNFLYGYVNKLGKEIIDVQYQEINRFTDIEDEKNVYLSVRINDEYLLFRNNKKLVDVEYNKIEYDKGTRLFKVINIENNVGVIDLKGNLVIPVQYSVVEFKKNYIKVTNHENETEFFDLKGTPLNDKGYKDLIGTSNDKYTITIDDRNNYGVVSSLNNKIIDNNYKYIEYLYDNYFIVKNENSKLGIIDDNNKMIVNFEYDTIGKINDTNAIIAKKIDDKIYDIYDNTLEKIATSDKINILKIDMDKESYIEVYMCGSSIYLNNKGEKVDVKQVYKNNE